MRPHGDQPIEWAGAPLDEALGVVIALHGRNASPRNILDLARRLDRPRLAYAAPAAANHTWYPLTFLAPLAENEPGLSSALDVIRRLVETVGARGIARDRVVLMGFSQGACLSAEFAVRHPARYGGLLVLSGGLIGPPGTTWDAAGSLAGTPVFLGCAEEDAHIPRARVEESASAFARRDAVVTCRLYPGSAHGVNEDEVGCARAMLDNLA